MKEEWSSRCLIYSNRWVRLSKEESWMISINTYIIGERNWLAGRGEFTLNTINDIGVCTHRPPLFLLHTPKDKTWKMSWKHPPASSCPLPFWRLVHQKQKKQKKTNNFSRCCSSLDNGNLKIYMKKIIVRMIILSLILILGGNGAHVDKGY